MRCRICESYSVVGDVCLKCQKMTGEGVRYPELVDYRWPRSDQTGEYRHDGELSSAFIEDFLDGDPHAS